MAIKHERLGMRRNLAFWLPLSCLVHSAPFDFQARDTIPWFYKEEAKAHRRYDFTSVRGIPIKRNNRWIRVSSFVFYLLEDKRHANLISSILERPWLPTLRPLIVPFFFLSFFFSFFFFFPLPFLSREYRSLSTSTRLRNLGYHGGHCADSRIGIKFQYTITLDPDFFYLIYPIRLIFLLAVPISK